MNILCLKTDTSIAELMIISGDTVLISRRWQADRQLGETLHAEVRRALKSARLSYKDIEGIVYYEGPGSFTGLRIAAAVLNALAFSYDIPIVQSSGEAWISNGKSLLLSERNTSLVAPHYGGQAHTTQPKK